VLATIKSVRGSVPKDLKVDLQVTEVKNSEVSAQLVLDRIVGELERRMPQRRAVGRAIERVMQAGGLGVKVVLAGRIGGADIARVEKYQQGSVPTQTMRANIDYAERPALLKKGYVGVKVWINRKNEE